MVLNFFCPGPFGHECVRESFEAVEMGKVEVEEALVLHEFVGVINGKRI